MSLETLPPTVEEWNQNWNLPYPEKILPFQRTLYQAARALETRVKMLSTDQMDVAGRIQEIMSSRALSREEKAKALQTLHSGMRFEVLLVREFAKMGTAKQRNAEVQRREVELTKPFKAFSEQEGFMANLLRMRFRTLSQKYCERKLTIKERIEVHRAEFTRFYSTLQGLDRAQFSEQDNQTIDAFMRPLKTMIDTEYFCAEEVVHAETMVLAAKELFENGFDKEQERLPLIRLMRDGSDIYNKGEKYNQEEWDPIQAQFDKDEITVREMQKKGDPLMRRRHMVDMMFSHIGVVLGKRFDALKTKRQEGYRQIAQKIENLFLRQRRRSITYKQVGKYATGIAYETAIIREIEGKRFDPTVFDPSYADIEKELFPHLNEKKVDDISEWLRDANIHKSKGPAHQPKKKKKSRNRTQRPKTSSSSSAAVPEPIKVRKIPKVDFSELETIREIPFSRLKGFFHPRVARWMNVGNHSEISSHQDFPEYQQSISTNYEHAIHAFSREIDRFAEKGHHLKVGDIDYYILPTEMVLDGQIYEGAITWARNNKNEIYHRCFEKRSLNKVVGKILDRNVKPDELPKPPKFSEISKGKERETHSILGKGAIAYDLELGLATVEDENLNATFRFIFMDKIRAL